MVESHETRRVERTIRAHENSPNSAHRGVRRTGGLPVYCSVEHIQIRTQADRQHRATAAVDGGARRPHRDMGLGSFATQGQFRWQSWPQEAVSPAFITRAGNGDKVMQELSGSIVRSPIAAGEPITAQKMIKAGQGGVLAAILPKGMRAISTRIKEETAAGRMILPNDHVDVILIRRLQSKDRGDNFVSDTMFRNVRVLAIGQQIETKDGKKVEAAANTATLELTPRQAELLALANSMGELSLTLRSIADGSPEVGASSDNPLNKDRGNTVKLLRYGVKSRAYGVN
jgi:pilus assembly protein CpaB